MKLEIETYILPAFWASALINGDESGMSESDIAEMDKWLNTVNPGRCLQCSDEQYFTGFNDAHTLACDVLEYSFTK